MPRIHGAEILPVSNRHSPNSGRIATHPTVNVYNLANNQGAEHDDRQH
jgi:hypothetical protein